MEFPCDDKRNFHLGQIDCQIVTPNVGTLASVSQLPSSQQFC